MRLYTTTGATQVDDPEHGVFIPDASGAFEFPDAMAAKLQGRPGWETDAVRDLRIASEELERFRDPATLLAEVKKMGASQGALTSLLAQALGIVPPADEAEPASSAPVEAPPAVVAEEVAAKSAASGGRGRGKTAKAAASTPES